MTNINGSIVESTTRCSRPFFACFAQYSGFAQETGRRSWEGSLLAEPRKRYMTVLGRELSASSNKCFHLQSKKCCCCCCCCCSLFSFISVSSRNFFFKRSLFSPFTSFAVFYRRLSRFALSLGFVFLILLFSSFLLSNFRSPV